MSTTPKSASRRTTKAPEGSPTPGVTAAPMGETLDAGQALSPSTRREQLVFLLQNPEGVTTETITAAFGWRPHTARAALSGLRKAGHSVLRETATDGRPIYRIALPEA